MWYYVLNCVFQLKNENERMREILIKSQEDDIYIDQETYLEVKQVFEKMKIFLDVMKKYGWVHIFYSFLNLISYKKI